MISHKSIKDYLLSQEVSCRQNYFDWNSIEKILRYGAPVGCKIEEHVELSRCMSHIQQLLLITEQKQESMQNGTVVIAEKLAHSSGRFERAWYAPEGGLWLSMIWADTLLPESSRFLPLVAGIACCEAVREYGVNASLKWVNDVHVNGFKIAGILCETVRSPIFDERYHLLGIGINVNNTTFPTELSGIAASIQGQTGNIVNLQDFAICLLAKLSWNIGLLHFQEEQRLATGDDESQVQPDSLVLSSWSNLTDSIGRRVMYGYDVQQKPLYKATVKKMNQDGGLVMELENGQILTEYSGEIYYLD